MSESKAEDVVARSRRLREAATPGPWDAWGELVCKTKAHGREIVANLYASNVSVPNPGDIALIATAPTLLAELEAEVERLRARERTLVEGYLIGEPFRPGEPCHPMAPAAHKVFAQEYAIPRKGRYFARGTTPDQARASAIRAIMEAAGLEVSP